MVNMEQNSENKYEKLLNTIFEENPTIRAIFDSIQAGISIATDASCHEIIHNPIAAEFFGISAWKNFAYLATKQLPVKVFHGGKKLLLEELPIQRAAWYGEITKNEEYEFVFDEGVRKVASVSAHPIWSASGQIMGAVATFQDITENKKNHLELLKQKHEINEILESISDAFFALDCEGRFIYINKEADRLFDYTRTTMGSNREELIGLSFWEAFPKYRESEIFNICEKVRVTKVQAHFETRMLYSKTEIDVNVYPFKDGISVYFRDISEHKKTEREMLRLQELKLVGEIAATISHEVRNPMTTVRGYLQILGNKDALKNSYKEQFDLMIEELDRANGIIQEFLSLSTTKVTQYRSQNLNTIIQRIMPMTQADAIKNDKIIELNLGQIPDLELDEKAIRQVLLNLIRNGLEAMPQRGVLTIETLFHENEVYLFIIDQGIGIPAEVLENIGKPFVTTKENGTGLGLAVCFKVLHEHNATIEFESNSGGTIVIIKFKANLSIINNLSLKSIRE